MAITLLLLFYILGVSALGGFAVCLLCFPTNLYVMRRVKRLQDKLMLLKDARMKVDHGGQFNEGGWLPAYLKGLHYCVLKADEVTKNS